MEEDLNKAFENIEKHDIKVSTVLIPGDCADKVIEDLKKLNVKIKEEIMYCPMCGSKMEEMKETEKKEWDLPIVINGEDKAEYFFCSKCQTPRTFHHPIYGITKAAGDSWAMSFIK